MSEAFAEPVAASEGQTQDHPTGPAPGDTLGAGIFEGDTQEDAPAEAEGQPEAQDDALAAPAEPEPAPSIDPESPEQQGLRQADYSRKTAELAREREAFEAERQAIAQERQQLIEQQQQQMELLKQLSGQAQQSTAPPSTEDALRQQIAQAQTIEERVHYEDTLRGYQHLQEQFRGMLESERAAMREEILREVQDAIGPTVQALTERQNNEQVEMYRAQAHQAREMFGDDVDRPEVVEFIRRNLGETGDDGQPLTIAQLVAMKTGRSVAEREAAQRNGRTQRHVARGRVAPPAAAGADISEVGGRLSKEEALAIIEANPYV